jgi:hypothetical protein
MFELDGTLLGTSLPLPWTGVCEKRTSETSKAAKDLEMLQGGSSSTRRVKREWLRKVRWFIFVDAGVVG